MKDLLKYAAITTLVIALALAAVALIVGLALFVRTAQGHQDVYHVEAAYRHFALGEPVPDSPASADCKKECPCCQGGCPGSRGACPCVEGGKCTCLPQGGCSCGTGCQCDPCPAERSKRP